MEITKAGQSYEIDRGLACAAVDVQLADVSLVLPSLCANYSDYFHAHRAGIALRAPVFCYHHRNSAGQSIAHAATQDNVESKIREIQKRHGPAVTVMSLEHPEDLTASGLAAFHDLQMRMGLPVITTVERNPMQDLGALRAELEGFDRLETDQERFPTISVRCDPGIFREKLLYVVTNYGGFNLQWGGYGKFADRWGILSAVLRDYPVWCNIVGILNREMSVPATAGQKVRTSGATRAFLYGGHSYCFAWPHYHPPPGAGTGKPAGQAGRPTLFNPKTWCHEPRELDYSMARTRSFNGMQVALGVARRQILAGTLYSRHCAQRPGLLGAMKKIPVKR